MPALYKDNQSIPQDMLLGNLIFTTLADNILVKESDLENILSTHGVPLQYMRPISHADAFRRASSSIKNKVIVSSNGVSFRAEIEEINTDVNGITRIIGFKHVDKMLESITYDCAAKLTYVRATDDTSLKVTTLDSDVSDCVLQVYNHIRNEFAVISTTHNRDTIKNLINRIMKDVHPISLMPTGLCKFVPKQHSALMTSLKESLIELSAYSSGSENIMEIIPIIDTEEQRNVISKNAEKEVTEDLGDIASELREILTTKGTITKRSLKSFKERYKNAHQKAKDYSSLLGIYFTGIEAQLKKLSENITDAEDNYV